MARIVITGGRPDTGRETAQVAVPTTPGAGPAVCDSPAC